MISRRLRVLVTGAFGNLGSHLVEELCARDVALTCFDLESPAARAQARRLSTRRAFAVAWGDIRAGERVAEVIAQARPDAIVHLAAVIPTLAYKRPALSQSVNVEGTRNVLASAEATGRAPRILFASSYAVHGARNGKKALSRLTADTPLAPFDPYGQQKVACERMLRESALPWSILRLGAVLPVRYPRTLDEADVRLAFELPADARDHAIHGRDAAVAFANALTADCVGKTLLIGGGEGWSLTKGEYLDRTLDALGIGALPRSAYCPADPDADAAWYFCDWLDTAEAEALLSFQRRRVDDYFRELARSTGITRTLARLAAPVVRRRLLRLSPYYRGDRRLVVQPTWERIEPIFAPRRAAA
ncbi:UDP-glucose 4-epimerase [Minicystis rosea]|nr:UDP-glucose 4-epimerase [Minicystis rosea]